MPRSFIGNRQAHDDDASALPHPSRPEMAGRSLYHGLIELIDFAPLLFQCLVDPVGTIRANVPNLIPSFPWGLSARKQFCPNEDIPDLGGKVILVTGGNTGLGRETVVQLARHNPSHIYLAARTPSKGEAAVREIAQAVPSATVTFLHLDLSSFGSIAAAVRQFTAASSRLDVLVNNAGIMATSPGTTDDGYELQFGTNYMGHALLTKLLLPTLLSTAETGESDVRIINVSSAGHILAPRAGILFDKSQLDAQGTWARYGQSKLANILFTRELASRYPGITSVAVHPGLIQTDLYLPSQRANWLVQCGTMTIGSLTMATAAVGTLNQLWAAAGKRNELVSGSYYNPVGNFATGSPHANDPGLAEALWDWTTTELAAHGY
ncbi:hypothetical protein MMC07_005837 [Pseudocyphellaria aurata]|nr:hypothetical protein [Pseudocyphellaria aurata]